MCKCIVTGEGKSEAWILPSCHEMLLLLLLLMVCFGLGCVGFGGYSPFHPERGNGLDVFFLPSTK